jgi:transcriptional regulator with GAF, ATPase, and Fis domain
MSEKEVIGILGVASELRRDFEKQADFLEILSVNISIAFRNALLFQELKDHASELEQEVSARKQMEEILGKKEKQLMDITDNIPALFASFMPTLTALWGFHMLMNVRKKFLA